LFEEDTEIRDWYHKDPIISLHDLPVIPTPLGETPFLNIFTVTQFLSEGLKRRRAADAINQIYHMTPCSAEIPDGFEKIREKYIAHQKRNRLAIVLQILVDASRNSSHLIFRGNIIQGIFQQVEKPYLKNGFLDKI